MTQRLSFCPNPRAGADAVFMLVLKNEHHQPGTAQHDVSFQRG